MEASPSQPQSVGRPRRTTQVFGVQQVMGFVCMSRLETLNSNGSNQTINRFLEQLQVNYYKATLIKGSVFEEILKEYEQKLRKADRYDEIVKVIFNNVATENDSTNFGRKYMKMLYYYFVPRNDQVQHDDWIMMAILIATDVILDALCKQKLHRARTLLYLSHQILCNPGFKKFNVGSWVFAHWITKSNIILSNDRQPSLMTNFDLLKLHVDLELPDVIFENIKTVTDKEIQKWRTTYANVEDYTRHDFAKENFSLTTRAPLSYPATKDVLFSFLVDRLDRSIDEGTKEAYKKTSYIYYSCRDLGYLTNALGHRISDTEMYKKVSAAVMESVTQKETITQQIEVFCMTMKLYIMVPGDFITYDQIITVALLTSDLTNVYLKKCLSSEAVVLYRSVSKRILGSGSSSPVITFGWLSIVDRTRELLCNREFFLMRNDMLIGGTLVLPVVKCNQQWPAVSRSYTVIKLGAAGQTGARISQNQLVYMQNKAPAQTQYKIVSVTSQLTSIQPGVVPTKVNNSEKTEAINKEAINPAKVTTVKNFSASSSQRSQVSKHSLLDLGIPGVSASYPRVVGEPNKITGNHKRKMEENTDNSKALKILKSSNDSKVTRVKANDKQAEKSHGTERSTSQKINSEDSDFEFVKEYLSFASEQEKEWYDFSD